VLEEKVEKSTLDMIRCYLIKDCKTTSPQEFLKIY
jgi:hypothetical protein